MSKKILLGITIIILLVISIVISSTLYNQSLMPPELIANFVDLNKVQEISPFRSCSGHTVVPQDKREMKRNMKHYIRVLPEYNKEDAVEVYAPYNGTISLLRSGSNLEGELWIAQDRGIFSMLPSLDLWMVNFEHIKPRADLKYGSKVKAGETVGYASFLYYNQGTFDVLYSKIGFPPKQIDNWNSPFADLDSVFNHMDNKVLAEFTKRGVNQENIIISKEARDSKPCVYRDSGPYFEGDGGLTNWVRLK